MESNEGLISTRSNASSAWGDLTNHKPGGQWELELPNEEGIKNLFKSEEIDDILFVITYEGEVPAWP